MASELTIGVNMNWYSPIDKPQLLPKDLLRHARKFTKDEAEKHILGVINKKPKPNLELGALQAQAILGGTSTSIPWGTTSLPWGTTWVGDTSTITYTTTATL